MFSLQAEISNSMYSNVYLKVNQVSRINFPWSFDVVAILPAVFMVSHTSTVDFKQRNFFPH